MVCRRSFFFSLLCVVFTQDAFANGRPPGTSTINFKRGDDSKIVAGMTFGVLASDDAGVTWRWMCEAAVGYGGFYDPDYVFASTGELFATTFDGLKIRHDACVFDASPTGTTFISTTTTGPDGAIYAAAADPADAKIYKSIDGGMTFPFASTAGQLSDWYSSIEVAPSDSSRVYLTAYRFEAGNVRVDALYRSSNAGATWDLLPVTDLTTQSSSEVAIVGISKTDPDLVYARVSAEDEAQTDALYRSTNGGQSWTRLLSRAGPLSVVLRANGELVAINLGGVGARSLDQGATWEDLVAPPHVSCLAESGTGEVWACTQNFGIDDAGIMKTTDLVTWTKVLRYQDIQAPVDCPAGTPQRDTCDAIWCGLCAQLGCDPKRDCPGVGVDSAPDGPSVVTPPPKGCCDAGASNAAVSILFACSIGLLLTRRRSRARSRLSMLGFGLVLASAGTTSLAHANGRAPETNGVFFDPADEQAIFIRSTFGLLVSRDDGCTFRWICEQNVGYGGTFDPIYAVAADGSIFATTFAGLRVSRDGGCSFTTATSELPEGATGRIADRWVDALDIGASGEIWVATADSGMPNDIYSSVDHGVTFTSRGMLSPTIWWKSLRVAPSDPMRIYATGYELEPMADASGSLRPYLFSTADGGATWNEHSLTSIQFGGSPIVRVHAVDPADPMVFYLVSGGANGANGDRLYRTSDGGTSFLEVLATTEAIRNVLVVDATTVLVATGKGGAYRSTDGGQTFVALSSGPVLGCIGKRRDGMLVGCGTNWQPDYMAAGRTSGDMSWQKIFRFVELAGPVECPAGTAQHDVCDQQLWPGLKEQFGATGPTCGAIPDAPAEQPAATASDGCCDASGRAPFGNGVLAVAIAFIAKRRRAVRS